VHLVETRTSRPASGYISTSTVKGGIEPNRSIAAAILRRLPISWNVPRLRLGGDDHVLA
jgi:hypothetical protein